MRKDKVTTMKRYVKIFALVASLILAIGVLSACSLMGPKSAKDCFDKNFSNSPDNYHMDVDIDMNMDMGFSDPETAAQLEAYLGTKTIEIPVDMEISMDVGKETAHGDLDLAMSMLGEKIKQSGEMYIDAKEGYSYTKMEDEDEWSKSSIEDNATFTQLFSKEDMEKVDWDKLKFEKTDNGYVVTGSAEDLGDSFMGDSTSAYLDSFDVDDFKLDGGDVKFVFDKQCRLTEAQIEGLTMKGSADMGSGMGDMDCTIVMDCTFEYSKFNEIDAEKYEIPKEVINGADEGDGGLGADGLLGGGGDAVEPTEPTTGGSNSGSGTVLNGADSQASPYCFTVGQDIAPGTYKVYRTSNSGSGVMSVSDAETFETNYNLNMGYGLDTDDPDGTTVVLENGDQIYMTDKLILEFR